MRVSRAENAWEPVRLLHAYDLFGPALKEAEETRHSAALSFGQKKFDEAQSAYRQLLYLCNQLARHVEDRRVTLSVRDAVEMRRQAAKRAGAEEFVKDTWHRGEDLWTEGNSLLSQGKFVQSQLTLEAAEHEFLTSEKSGL